MVTESMIEDGIRFLPQKMQVLFSKNANHQSAVHIYTTWNDFDRIMYSN